MVIFLNCLALILAGFAIGFVGPDVASWRDSLRVNPNRETEEKP